MPGKKSIPMLQANHAHASNGGRNYESYFALRRKPVARPMLYLQVEGSLTVEDSRMDNLFGGVF